MMSNSHLGHWCLFINLLILSIRLFRDIKLPIGEEWKSEMKNCFYIRNSIKMCCDLNFPGMNINKIRGVALCFNTKEFKLPTSLREKFSLEKIVENVSIFFYSRFSS